MRVKAPMLRIHTVAAGGGSLCRFDGFRLTVGPESAGADPGPLCYDLRAAGRRAQGAGALTLTDVNLALGRVVDGSLSVRARLASPSTRRSTRCKRACRRAGFERVATRSPRASSRSRTRAWRRRFSRSPSSAVPIRGITCWSASAAPLDSTSAPSPGGSASARSCCIPTPDCSPPTASGSRPHPGTGSATGSGVGCRPRARCPPRRTSSGEHSKTKGAACWPATGTCSRGRMSRVTGS